MRRRIERINTILSDLRLTKHSLANQSGIAPSNLNKMLAGDQTITDKTLQKIVKAFPQISYDWLRTGEGEMKTDFVAPAIDSQESLPDIADLIATISKQADIIKSQQETIQSLSKALNGLVAGDSNKV